MDSTGLRFGIEMKWTGKDGRDTEVPARCYWITGNEHTRCFGGAVAIRGAVQLIQCREAL
jgi:hypothetical protein